MAKKKADSEKVESEDSSEEEVVGEVVQDDSSIRCLKCGSIRMSRLGKKVDPDGFTDSQELYKKKLAEYPLRLQEYRDKLKELMDKAEKGENALTLEEELEALKKPRKPQKPHRRKSKKFRCQDCGAIQSERTKRKYTCSEYDGYDKRELNKICKTCKYNEEDRVCPVIGKAERYFAESRDSRYLVVPKTMKAKLNPRKFTVGDKSAIITSKAVWDKLRFIKSNRYVLYGKSKYDDDIILSPSVETWKKDKGKKRKYSVELKAENLFEMSKRLLYLKSVDINLKGTENLVEMASLGEEIQEKEKEHDDLSSEVSTLRSQCQHIIVKDGVSAKCPVCERDFGWWCPKSPDHLCHYYTEEREEGIGVELQDGTFHKPKLKKNHNRKYETDDACLYCGNPMERK